MKFPGPVVFAAVIGARGDVALPCQGAGRTFTLCEVPWKSMGPSGVSEDDGSATAMGAVQQVVEGPSGVWFAASVNGGVWRTKDITIARPHWEPVTDGQPVRCSSMSAVARHKDDSNTIYAGCGASTSGEQGVDVFIANTGDWGGVMVSEDGGDSWRMTNFPPNWYVSSIISMGGKRLAVATAAHFFDEGHGGVWISEDGGASWDMSLGLGRPFDLKFDAASNTLVVAVTDVEHEVQGVQMSNDGGLTWSSWGQGLAWPGYRSFYSTLALSPAADVAFLGVFYREQAHLGNTSSKVYRRRIAASEEQAGWALVENLPMNLDQDHMPKDRMGLLVDPESPELLYVSGNADAFAWRVEWEAGKWHDLEKDTVDRRGVHGDTRSLAWDDVSKSVILTSDGGVFLRSLPGAKGGKWRSLNGDMRQMEMTDAKWDARLHRWIGGAQDNSVQLSPPGADADAVSFGLVGGDGTVVDVDNVNDPSRLFGCSQFLGGVVEDDGDNDDKSLRSSASLECDGGFCFTQGTPGVDQIVVTIPMEEWFPAQAFPYFVSDFHLNLQNTSELFFWLKAYPQDPDSVSGWHLLEVPPSVLSSSDLKKPKMVLSSSGANILGFVAGGTTDGQPDPTLIVGINETHLLRRAGGGDLELTELPLTFATPTLFDYDEDGDYLLGPLTHARTAFLSVSPADSRVVAITGWTDIYSNGGVPGVWLTNDAGRNWVDATGDLAEATATLAQPRPSGVLLVDFPELKASALLVGTVSGAFLSWTDRLGKWSRLGSCRDLPLVLVMSLSYEPYSDVLLAATYGRGVYSLQDAKHVLARARLQQDTGSCEATLNWVPSSSAAYLPPMETRSAALI